MTPDATTGSIPDFTPEALSALTGAGISLFFNLFPRVSERFHSLRPDSKQKFMLALSAGASIVAALWICSEDPSGLAVCLRGGWRTLVQAVVAGWIANTSMDRALPESFKRGKQRAKRRQERSRLRPFLDPRAGTYRDPSKPAE